MSISAIEQTYVLAYSGDIRRNFVEALRKRWIAYGWITQPPKPQGPITDGFEILEPERAGHDLFMALMRYYRAFGDAPTGQAASVLIALQRGIHDAQRCVSVLNDALCFFVDHEASRDDAGVRRAVQAAQLSLKTLQGTWAEMPAMVAQSNEYWLIQ